jgi:hypothetical protein
MNLAQKNRVNSVCFDIGLTVNVFYKRAIEKRYANYFIRSAPFYQFGIHHLK